MLNLHLFIHSFFFVWALNSDLPIAEQTLKMSQSRAALREHFLLFLIKFYMSQFSGNLRNFQEVFQGQRFLTRFTAATAEGPCVWAL